ncbi:MULTISPECIES: YfhO family protein [Methylobacter]
MKHYNNPKLAFVICIFITALISAWAFRDVLLLNKLYIFLDVGSDSFAIGLPHLLYISNLLKAGAIPLWSHGIGNGQSTLALNHTIFDPFNWVLFFTPTEKMLPMIGYIVWVKSSVAAGIFFTLCRRINLSNYTSIIGGIIYGLNGYLILWGQHYFFALAVIYYPLLLLGLEFWLRDRKASLFLGTMFLIAIWSYYFLYMMSIFLLPYLLIRVFTQDLLRSQAIRHCFEFTALYLLGIGLAAFIFVPSVFVALDSPRIGSQFADIPFLMKSEYYLSLVSRFFSAHFKVGNHHFYDWWNIYELPNVYCSVLALLLLPVACLNYPQAKRKFLNWTIISIVFALIFPVFGLFANAFSYISYRWTFAIIPIILLFSLRGLQHLERAEKPPASFLLLSYAGLSILLLCTTLASSSVFGWADVSTTDEIIAVIPTLLFLGVYTILLILLSHEKWKKTGKVGILFVLALELANHVSTDVHDRALLSADYPAKKTGVFDESKDSVNELKEKQKDFFRVIKTTAQVSFNDPIAQGFFGTTSYEPLNSRGTLDFLKIMDVYSPNNNYIKIPPDRLLLNSFLAVRYQILDNPNDMIVGYKFVEQKGNISIFENTNFLPLGLIFDQYTELSSFQKLPSFERDRTILKAVVVNDNSVLKEGLKKAKINAVTLPSSSQLKLDLPSNFINMDVKENNFPLNLEFDTKFNDPYIVIRSSKPLSGLLRISFVFETAKDVTGQVYWRYGDDAFKIDKAQYFLVTRGIKNYDLNLGYVGNVDRLRVELSNTPGRFKISSFKVEVTPVPIMDEYKKDAEILRSKAMAISRWSESKIEGDVNLLQNGILVMQIPIAPGWEALIDDLPIKIEAVNGGLIGFPIQQGKHKVVLEYKPPFLFIGVIISTGSWIAIFLWFFRRYFLTTKIGLSDANNKSIISI